MGCEPGSAHERQSQRGSPNGRDQCNRAGESYFHSDAAAGQNVWYCTALPSTWTNQSSASGSVTSLSAGTLSPLFTTSVATATTTPALSFILSNFSADNIFGNFAGSSAAPSTQAIPACANDGSHALVYPSHTLTCETITTFTWPSAGIMVSTGSAAGTSLTTTSGLQGVTFAAGVPSLTALGTAATSNSSAFQPAITGVANEVFGGTGPGMIALTSSYLPLSSMGTITGGVWNGTAIGSGYGGTGGSSGSATGIAHVSSGTWAYSAVNLASSDVTGVLPEANLPAPAGGGPPGGVASITSGTGAISTSEATIASYTIPANTIQAGTTYRLTAIGNASVTSSTAAGVHFYVRFGSTGTSSDTAIGSINVTSATVGTAINFTVVMYVTFQSTTASQVQGYLENATNTGIYTGNGFVGNATNTTGLTTTSNEILQLSFVSAGSTVSATLNQAVIELIKP